MFLLDITLVLVLELLSNMEKKRTSLFLGKYKILLCLLFSVTMGMIKQMKELLEGSFSLGGPVHWTKIHSPESLKPNATFTTNYA